MGWLERLSRNLGLMFHNIRHPDHPAGIVPAAHRQQVSHTVEERKISPTMTLRRTTIEEVEVGHPRSNHTPSTDANSGA